MSTKTFTLSDSLHEYLLRVSVREPEILRRLRQETAALPDATMQISPEQGRLMSLLIKATGARHALEIGVFTGYSSICVAQALPRDGSLIACDRNEKWVGIARRYWKEAGVDNKIELRLGPALETLEALIAEGKQEGFDFIFIDADKENYAHYYERSLVLIRKGGLIAVDNVLWSGRVANPDENDKSTVAIREFNEMLYRDARIELSVIPIGDGLTLALKK
jgi:predicted O-methyltransferase YrrM